MLSLFLYKKGAVMQTEKHKIKTNIEEQIIIKEKKARTRKKSIKNIKEKMK